MAAPATVRVCCAHGSVVVVSPASSPSSTTGEGDVRCGSSGWTWIATSARSRSRRRARCGWRDGCRPSRRRWRCSRRASGGDDEVALETTGNALEIARILEPQVARVVLANPKAVKGITRAGAKTDQIDARTLAKLLAGGFLPAVWLPDEQTRILRRRISARAQLVRQRTRAKNQVHATLIRNLKGKPPVSDLFGARGRRWLAAQVLPEDERETVAACLRQIEFLDREIALIERALAEQVLASAEMRRLLTLPGVNFVTAAALIAAIGDIGRFPSARQLVSYLGLDPRVRQSGTEPARHGQISKQGSGEP